MRGMNKLKWIKAVGCLLMSLMILPAQGQSPDPETLAKEINNELRTAERLMYNGKKEEADVMLEEAGGKLAALREADPDNSKLSSLQSTYDRTRRTLDKRLGRTTKQASSRPLPPKPSVPEISSRKTPVPSSPPASPETDSGVTVSKKTVESPAKLPGGVSKRLRDIDQALDKAKDELAEGDTDQAAYQLDKVPDLIGQIERMYAGQFSKEHPDYVAMEQRYAAVQEQLETVGKAQAKASAEAEAAKAAEAAVADEWLVRFAPYISGSYLPAGHAPAKPLVFPGTAHPEKIPGAKAIYDEAKSLYEVWLQSGLAEADIPWQLNQAASDLKFALDGFESSLKSATNRFVEDAQSNIDQALEQLQSTDWQGKPEAMPPMIPKDWMERMKQLVEDLDNILPDGNSTLPGLKDKLAQVEKMDRANRIAGQERMRVRPEAYKGKDLKDLREKAKAIVLDEFPAADVLRISIYKADWKEESVIESTDSTNTAVRHRITRMINAQVAAKRNGETHLHTLHIAKDKRTDGSWGPLYGHVMYSDVMLEENVGE